jgi:hypothetical protein
MPAVRKTGGSVMRFGDGRAVQNVTDTSGGFGPTRAAVGTDFLRNEVSKATTPNASFSEKSPHDLLRAHR